VLPYRVGIGITEFSWVSGDRSDWIAEDKMLDNQSPNFFFSSRAVFGQK